MKSPKILAFALVMAVAAETPIVALAGTPDAPQTPANIAPDEKLAPKLIAFEHYRDLFLGNRFKKMKFEERKKFVFSKDVPVEKIIELQEKNLGNDCDVLDFFKYECSAKIELMNSCQDAGTMAEIMASIANKYCGEDDAKIKHELAEIRKTPVGTRDRRLEAAMLVHLAQHDNYRFFLNKYSPKFVDVLGRQHSANIPKLLEIYDKSGLFKIFGRVSDFYKNDADFESNPQAIDWLKRLTAAENERWK